MYYKQSFLLLLAIVIIYRLFNMATPDINEQSKTIASEYEITVAKTLMLHDDGNPKAEITANRIWHDPYHDNVLLDKPSMILYSSDAPLSVDADQGLLNVEQDLLTLEGGVQLTQELNGNNLYITTASAQVFLEQQYANGEQSVTVQHQSFTTHAIGFYAYFQEKRIKFINDVHTKIQADLH